MKTLVLLSAVFLVGCDGYDALECYNTVTIAYPNSEVRNIPGQKWSFLAKTPNGEIRYIQTMNILNTDITADTVIFK